MVYVYNRLQPGTVRQLDVNRKNAALHEVVEQGKDAEHLHMHNPRNPFRVIKR